jgi:predicted membrane metal-binding protein
MECLGTTDFDDNSRLITISAIIISGLHRTYYFSTATVVTGMRFKFTLCAHCPSFYILSDFV